MDAESERWLSGLRCADPVLQEATWTDLCRYACRVAVLCLRKHGQFSEAQIWDIAEDVAQEALIDIMRRLDTFRGRSRFTTWVFSLVRLNALEVLRKYGSRVMSPGNPNGHESSNLLEMVADPGESGPESDAEVADLLRATHEIINAGLTERQRRVLLLNAAGYSAAEIADLLDITTNNTYYLLHVARKKLAHELRARGYAAGEAADSMESAASATHRADCPRPDTPGVPSPSARQALHHPGQPERNGPKESAPFDTYGCSEEK